MTQSKLSTVLATVMALAVALPTAAQTPPGGRVGYRVMTRLTVQVLGTLAPGAGLSDGELWAASLDTAIRRSGYAREIQRSGEGDFLKAAALGGFQLIIQGTARIDGPAERVTVDYQVLDVLSGQIVLSDTITAPLPNEYELGETFWIPLISKLEKIVPTERRTYIRIRGERGSRVSGFGPKPLVIGDSGELRVEVFVPGTYPWKAEKWGSFTQSGVFAALENDAVLRIPPAPLRLWAVETGIYMMQFPDLWLERYFLQDHVFVRLGLQQYLFGFYLPDPYSSSITKYQGIISLPMVQPGFALGYQFGAPENFIHPYVYGAALLRYDLDIRVPDPIAPLETQGMFGLSWRATPRVSLFAEIGTSFYPFCKGYLMMASKGATDEGPFAVLYGNDYFLEFPRWRLGVRFFL